MSAPADMLHVSYHFPGRLRVRAEKFRTPSAAAAAAARVRSAPGVASVTASEVTGSLLILYDPAVITLDRLLPAVVTAGELTGIAPYMRPRPENRPGRRLRASLARMDARLHDALSGKLDIRTGVPGLLLVAGLARFAKGNRILPKWYELVFWSFVTFINVNPHEPETKPHAP